MGDPTTLEEQPGVEAIPFDPLAGLPGQLAILDESVLIVSNPNGSGARIVDGGGATGAAQPVWAPGGQTLGWVSYTDVDILITQLQMDGDAKSQTSIGSTFPVYMQWNAAGDTLAYLRPNPFGGPELELGTVVPGEPAKAIGTAVPFYVSFAPDDNSILGHINDGQLVIWSDGPNVDLGPASGSFTAPAWLDQNRVLVHLDDALTVIDLRDGSENVVAPIGRSTEFVVNPNHELVAFQAGPPELMTVQDGGGPTSTLRVAEIDTGLEVIVTDKTVAAFEWSPDGSMLAWLEVPEGPSVGGARWHYWAGGEVAVSPEYFPSQMVVEQYLPYFAQFAQSHSGWSANGEAFAFAGRIGEDEGIWVQVMDPTEPPILIGFGSMVIWSPDGEVTAGV
ncbi:MAG: hypothetical protein R2706_14420, partial [Acidimicrobiales bacterium]